MNDNYISNYVLGEYYSLGDGEVSKREVCPACKGGSSKEKTFTVTRRGDSLIWNCFRASCTSKGFVRTAGEYERYSPRVRPTQPAVRIYPLGEEDASRISRRYGLSRESLRVADVGWTGRRDDSYGGRVSYPIFRPDSKCRGYVYRSYTGGLPKALTWLNEGQTQLAWYKFLRKSPTLVVVEDQVSAIRLAEHTHSVALMGTELTDDKLQEIAKEKYTTVYLALDRDATLLALKLQFKSRNLMGNLKVLPLHRDIKDMNPYEFESLLERIK